MELMIDERKAFVYTGTRALDPALPTIVFLHGAGMDHTVWLLQSRYFAHHGYNALAVDLPGHGRSAGPLLASVAELADWTVRLLDAAGLALAALVGHSMGSLVALDCAARHPARVSRLALLGTAAPMPVGKVLLDAAQANDQAAIDMITLWGHGPAALLGGHPIPGLWMTGQALRLLERAAPGVLFTDLNACNAYTAGLDQATQVRCPVQVLSGARDQMTPPRAARALLQALPQVQTVTLNCGHMLMTEQPDAVLDALLGFMRT